MTDFRLLQYQQQCRLICLVLPKRTRETLKDLLNDLGPLLAENKKMFSLPGRINRALIHFASYIVLRNFIIHTRKILHTLLHVPLLNESKCTPMNVNFFSCKLYVCVYVLYCMYWIGFFSHPPIVVSKF